MSIFVTNGTQSLLVPERYIDRVVGTIDEEGLREHLIEIDFDLSKGFYFNAELVRVSTRCVSVKNDQSTAFMRRFLSKYH